MSGTPKLSKKQGRSGEKSTGGAYSGTNPREETNTWIASYRQRLSFLCYDLRIFQDNQDVERRLQSSIYLHNIGPPYLSEEDTQWVLTLSVESLRIQDRTDDHAAATPVKATLVEFLEQKMQDLIEARGIKAERNAEAAAPDFVLCTSHDLAPILQEGLCLPKHFSDAKSFKQVYKKWEKEAKKAEKRALQYNND